MRSAAGQTRNGARGMAVRLGESIDAQGGAQALRPPGGLGWAAQITTTGGNLVILNRGTLARFTREHQIEIERGEVFVEVVDRRKMFIAEAKGATVEVHGTEFNLALAQGRGEVTVTVAEGTVLFSNRHGSCSVRAGGQSCAAGENAPAPPIRVALQPIVAWAGVSVTEPAAVRLSLPSGLNQALFAGGEIPTLLVRIGYLFDEYVPLGLECRVLDVASGVVARSAEPISGPGFRYTNRRVTFGQLKPGTYRAEVRLEGRDDLLAETRFNVRP